MNRNILLSLFILFACTTTRDENSIFIDNSDCNPIVVDSVFDSWRLIEMDYLISRVDDLILYEEKIFILDRQLESIKIFDGEGNSIKVFEGDIFENGKPIQPVCMYKSHSGGIGFYDAANESIILIDRDLTISNVSKSNFYASKIYPIETGYLVFKNQTVQNDEVKDSHFNVLLTNLDFEIMDKFMEFSIENNVPRNWQFFPDPVQLTKEGFEFFEPLNFHYLSYDKSKGLEKIPIVFANRGLKAEDLEGVDIEDPFDVLENVFKKYAMINAKKLQSDTGWGIRFIDNFKSNYFFQNPEFSSGICLSELYVEYDGANLIIPFPSYVDSTAWISILDGFNYEVLNLPTYSNLHPILDQVVKDGKTYIVIMENRLR